MYIAKKLATFCTSNVTYVQTGSVVFRHEKQAVSVRNFDIPLRRVAEGSVIYSLLRFE